MTLTVQNNMMLTVPEIMFTFIVPFHFCGQTCFQILVNNLPFYPYLVLVLDELYQLIPSSEKW